MTLPHTTDKEPIHKTPASVEEVFYNALEDPGYDTYVFSLLLAKLRHALGKDWDNKLRETLEDSSSAEIKLDPSGKLEISLFDSENKPKDSLKIDILPKGDTPLQRLIETFSQILNSPLSDFYSALVEKSVPEKQDEEDQEGQEEKTTPSYQLIDFSEIKEESPPAPSDKEFGNFMQRLHQMRQLPPQELFSEINKALALIQDASQQQEFHPQNTYAKLVHNLISKEREKTLQKTQETLLSALIALFEKHKSGALDENKSQDHEDKKPFQLFDQQIYHLYSDISFLTAAEQRKDWMIFHRLRVSEGKTSVLIPILSAFLSLQGKPVHLHTINQKLKTDLLTQVSSFLELFPECPVYDLENLTQRLFTYTTKIMQGKPIQEEEIPDDLKSFFLKKASDKRDALLLDIINSTIVEYICQPKKITVGEWKNFIFAWLRNPNFLYPLQTPPIILLDEADHIFINETYPLIVAKGKENLWDHWSFIENEVSNLPEQDALTQEISLQGRPDEKLARLLQTLFTISSDITILDKQIAPFLESISAAFRFIEGKDFKVTINDGNIEIAPISSTGYIEYEKRYRPELSLALFAAKIYPHIKNPATSLKKLLQATEVSSSATSMDTALRYYTSLPMPIVGFSGTFPGERFFEKIGVNIIKTPPHFGDNRRDFFIPLEGFGEKLRVLPDLVEKSSTKHKIILTYSEEEARLVQQTLEEAASGKKTTNIVTILPQDTLNLEKLYQTLRSFEKEGGVLIVPRIIYRGVDLHLDNALLISTTVFPTKEELQQALGRVGRKGKSAETITLISSDDVSLQSSDYPENLQEIILQIKNEPDNPKNKKRLLEELEKIWAQNESRVQQRFSYDLSVGRTMFTCRLLEAIASQITPEKKKTTTALENKIPSFRDFKRQLNRFISDLSSQRYQDPMGLLDKYPAVKITLLALSENQGHLLTEFYEMAKQAVFLSSSRRSTGMFSALHEVLYNHIYSQLFIPSYLFYQIQSWKKRLEQTEFSDRESLSEFIQNSPDFLSFIFDYNNVLETIRKNPDILDEVLKELLQDLSKDLYRLSPEAVKLYISTRFQDILHDKI